MKKHGIYELLDTTLKDTFLEDEEMLNHVGEINDRLQSGETIKGVSFSSIGIKNFLKLYQSVEKKIYKLECDEETKLSLIEEVKALLGLSSKDTKMVNNIDNNMNNELNRKNDYTKTLLAETLVELVDEGVFDESQMHVVEDQIALLLNSIEDYRPVSELEK